MFMARRLAGGNGLDNMLALHCHVAHPAKRVKGASAHASVDHKGNLLMRYVIESAAHNIEVGERTPPRRLDNLWQTTCLEVFVKTKSAAEYLEYNLAPSGDWACYGFAGYRAEMTTPDSDIPHIDSKADGEQYLVNAAIMLPAKYHRQPLDLAICAIIEETQGTKSLWALRHGEGPADFHDPDCFMHQLVPATEA